MDMRGILDDLARQRGIDVGFGPKSPESQIAATLRKQMARLGSTLGNVVDTYQYRDEARRHISELDTRVSPYKLPEDYRMLLEMCGGFRMKPYTTIPGSQLQTYGIGTLADDWFPFLLGDHGADGPAVYGLLPLAIESWGETTQEYSTYFLNMRPELGIGSVFLTEPNNGFDGPSDSELVRRAKGIPTGSRFIATSVLEWLAGVLDTYRRTAKESRRE